MFESDRNKEIIHELWWKDGVLILWALIASAFLIAGFFGFLKHKGISLDLLPWFASVSLLTWGFFLFEHYKLGMRLGLPLTSEAWGECKKVYPYVEFNMGFKLFTLCVYGILPLSSTIYAPINIDLMPSYWVYMSAYIVSIVIDLYIIMQLSITRSRI